MPNKYPLMLFFLSALLFSCAVKNNDTLIIGNWQCVQWTAEGTDAGYDIAHTQFHFKQNELYEAVITGRAEIGTWYREGSKLYTTAEGSAKIMTNIITSTQDSLVLGMNRGGINEQMVLLRMQTE
ncbi:MAG: lipocalin family protein [Chitinophagales bacterium]